MRNDITLRAVRGALLLLAGAAGGAAADVDTAEQVLVTASRLPESGSALPLSWSSVDADALALTGHVHINELMQRVPGAWLSRGNGQESLAALRSPVLTGAGGCGAFFMAFDGISLRAPGFCNINQMFDANTEQAGRIEVIRGPASALYGSNAMHGVINVISAAPTEAPSSRVSLEAGPDDYYRGKVHYGNTWGRHGVSLSAHGTSDGGYKDDSGYDEQKMTLRHDYAGELWSFSSAVNASNLNQETAGYIQGFEAYKDDSLKDTNPNPEAYRDARSLLAYSRASRALGDNHQLVLTPYVRDNQMEFLMHFLAWQPVEENGHRSLGLQAAVHSDLGAWQWINGSDIDFTDGWLKETQAEDFSPNQPAGVHYDYEVEASTAALFSQLRWSADALTLDGGVRWEYTRYDYDNQTADGDACSPDASACRFYRPADRDDDFDNFSLNAGASYALGESQLVFLRAARGFRAPQATELYRLQSGQRVADLDSEQLDNLEVGLRGTLAQSLSYEISAYAMDKDNVIFQDSNRYNVSGASTEHRGIEASLAWTSDTWYAEADASFARHTYSSRIQLLGSSGDIKGNDVDTAPREFGSARLGRRFGRGVAELEWVYMGEYFLDPDNEHEYDGHSLFNLRLSADLGRQWQASLRLTNLLDEDYAERADYGFGSYRYFVGQPRGAYLEVAYSPGG
ncbi:TonB-dependent receptor [Mangrovimicrobium sediminis]|uniref:TonB-dependent receptor n=1 Tax=Mangrovimicrobium sediminis TaxID=2562682 RepID=A0A4Z0M5R0_9GAMM|nr:TonB-dependent receptor [Haliea sp. SAOS-164]TGD74708.1 TonB-dependent receptor [Haliea sp. SAOS-164]